MKILRSHYTIPPLVRICWYMLAVYLKPCYPVKGYSYPTNVSFGYLLHRLVWVPFPGVLKIKNVCHPPRTSVPPIQAISCAHRSLNSPFGTSPIVTPLRKRTGGMQIDNTIRDGASPKRSTIIAKIQTQYELTVRKKVDKRSSGAHQGLAKVNKHPIVPLLILRSC